VIRALAASFALLAAAPLAAQASRAPIVAWTYTVQAGDTFSDIARRWGVSMVALGEASGQGAALPWASPPALRLLWHSVRRSGGASACSAIQAA
jgi:hypothetical protein